MTGVLIKCTAMCWNGVRIGTANIHRSQSLTQKDQNRAPPVCCAAAHGSVTVGSAVLPVAIAPVRPLATAALAFALLEVNELKPSQVNVVEQASSRLAAARLTMAERMGDRRGMLHVFILHKLVILSRPLYNPCITTNLIFLDERCKCK